LEQWLQVEVLGGYESADTPVEMLEFYLWGDYQYWFADHNPRIFKNPQRE